jgi:hypothetical protein
MEKSSTLVDLIATQAPEASAQGESVVLIAPVIVAGRPDAPGQVRLTLTVQQTELFSKRLEPALRIARQISQQRT